VFRRPSCASTLATLAATAVVGLGVVAPAAGATTVTPPADPQAVGQLTLCNRDGNQITSGLVDAVPVVWRAIDTTPAPAGYAKYGTATLYATQPRPETPPGDWSSEQLTSTARFSDGAHPMAAATTIDESLATYLGDYPLLNADHLLQLRIYLSAYNKQEYSIAYDASYLQVNGNTWTQLNPGPDDCASAGHALALETVEFPAKDFKVKPTPAQSVPGTPATSPGASDLAAGSGTAAPTTSGGSSPPGATDVEQAASEPSSSSDTGHNVVLVVCAVLIAGLGGAAAVRRRR
jgi:hypothetical protein